MESHKRPPDRMNDITKKETFMRLYTPTKTITTNPRIPLTETKWETTVGFSVLHTSACQKITTAL